MGNVFQIKTKRFDLIHANSSKFIVNRQMLGEKDAPSTKRYTLLEYILSTGTQRIESIRPAFGSYVELDMEFVELPTATETIACGVYYGGLAVRSGTTYRIFGMKSDGTTGSYSDVSIGDNKHIKLTYNTDGTVTLYSFYSNSIIKSLTNTYLRHPTDDWKNLYYLLFCGLWEERGSYEYVKTKVYSLKIGNSATDLQANLIPVKDRNNILCMYDLVSKSFIYSKTDNNFIAGPEV